MENLEIDSAKYKLIMYDIVSFLKLCGENTFFDEWCWNN